MVNALLTISAQGWAYTPAEGFVVQINSIETAFPTRLRAQNEKTEPLGKAGKLFVESCERFLGNKEGRTLNGEQLLVAAENLFPHLNSAAKKAASKLLADHPLTPRAIAIWLAMEPIEVGGAMLSRSPVLGQLDLMRIAKTCGNAHARCIAGRPDCGAALSRQVGKTPEDKAAFKKVAPQIRISNAAFLPKMATGQNYARLNS